MGEEPMLDVLSRVGFGQVPGTTYPGETFGMLPNHSRWSKADIATLSYGYGFKVSPLQLAQAYLVFASGGFQKPLSLLKGDGTEVQGTRVISQEIVRQVVPMMESVVSTERGGTGVKAGLSAYRVAGKTGTAWVYDVAAGEYDTKSYTSLFAGFLPVSNPEIVIVVTVHRPQGEEYDGGAVAAPVFGKIAEGAMRILNIPPDKLELQHLELSSNTAVPAVRGAR
jgi:cell division protein FtsI (penicillin-binding protein 3)